MSSPSTSSPSTATTVSPSPTSPFAPKRAAIPALTWPMEGVFDAQPGDILFYAGEDWESRLIERFTGVPPLYVYSHCEVVRERTARGVILSIGALGRGITHHIAPHPEGIARVGKSLPPFRRTDALRWLDQQVGERYGGLDIAADVLSLLLPFRTPFLVRDSRYDCSDLCTRFLTFADVSLLPPAFVTDPFHVSPSTLAQALHATAL